MNYYNNNQLYIDTDMVYCQECKREHGKEYFKNLVNKKYGPPMTQEQIIDSIKDFYKELEK